jgi:hypothetical protein
MPRPELVYPGVIMLNFPAGWRFAVPAHPLAFRTTSLSKARQLVTRSGKRSRGRFPTAKAPVAQCYESQLELSAFRLLELAPSVQAFTAQPAQMRLQGAPVLRYTPDLAVVLVDGSQHLLEVKPARILLEPRVLERVTEIVRLYEERGDVLHFLLDIDLGPTPARGKLLRDALHWDEPSRIAPQLPWPEHKDGPCGDAEEALPVCAPPPECFGTARLDAIRRDCDSTLERVLNRSFADTLAAARDAQWTGGRP